MKIKILFFCALISLARAADPDDYKKCTQSSFCRRSRNIAGSYEVDASTVTFVATRLTAEIGNKENDQRFVMKLGAILQDNTFHFEIDEKNPLKPRYRVTEALKEEPKFDGIVVVNSTSEITVTSKQNKAVIKLSPFKIDFYQDNVLAVTVNGKNLFRFEHLRVKPQTLDPAEDPDSWEETFNTTAYTSLDTKPNGPEAVALDFTFPESEVLFGIPEHSDTFALKSTIGAEPYRLYTSDVPGYDLDSRMALYGAIPVIYSHGIKRSVGVYWQNSADTFIDIHDNKAVQFISEAGYGPSTLPLRDDDVFVMLGPSAKETFNQYTQLTGVANLPQLFSLAYHQSRWNYLTQDEVIEVVDKFDESEIQLDTVWLDIEYTDGKKYFTWEPHNFTEPLKMIANLTSTGRHLAFIIDPHTKLDDEYFYYKENKERGFFVKASNGSDYEGSCWPGMSSYVDYFNPEALKYYADQYLMENFKDNDVDTGIWNDMNEPAVFDVPEKTMPRDNLHFSGTEQKWEHRNVHNQYGLMHVKGTFDGVQRRGNLNYRPFILTRAFFSGSQRYSAVWTGDNGATWGYLQASVKMCLTISVSGISFCGSDVGGFFDDPEKELFVRWYQAAAFQPFFRSHANLESPRREPYLLQEPYKSIAREAIRRRYALLPLWYTMFYEHERFGHPVMRPMLMDYPLDKDGFTLDDQYMLQDKLLVRPVMEKGLTKVNVRFPSVDGANASHIWYDTLNFATQYRAAGVQSIDVKPEAIPVYQRGGTIIAMKEVIRKSSVHMVDDPISLYVAVDGDEKAQGTLYIDDGKTYDYRNKKQYLYLQFDFDGKTFTSKKIDKDAVYETKSKLDKITIVGLETMPEYATFENAAGVKTRFEINNPEAASFSIAPSANLNEEWKITLNGAKQNILCASLLLVVSMVHFAKHLFN